MRRNRNVNPVANAVARAQLQQMTVDQKIELYLLKDGDPCELTCSILRRIFITIANVAGSTKGVGPEDPRVRKLRGAASACEQMADADRYQVINTVALDQALDLVLEFNRVLDPNRVLAMWAKSA